MQHAVCATLQISLCAHILKPMSCVPGEKLLFPQITVNCDDSGVLHPWLGEVSHAKH